MLVGTEDPAGKRPSPEPLPVTQPVSSTVSTLQASPAQTLIRGFLNKNKWSESDLEKFLQQWHTLSSEHKDRAMSTIEIGQLANAITKQVLEERALSGLGDTSKSDQKLSQLVQFADQIGITQPPTTLPEQTVTAELADEPSSDTKNDITAMTSSGKKNNASGCTLTSITPHTAYCRDDIGDNIKGPTMVIIPAEKLVMGAELEVEQAKHDIHIDYQFAMSVHEITYGEYREFCVRTQRDYPVQPWVGKDFPVVNVSWYDAVAYTEWLSDITSHTYRLPSEAEWEYSARAGATTSYPFGNTITAFDAVYSANKILIAPLPKTDRSINRNNFRLYHMPGNVREWVADAWHNNDATSAMKDLSQDAQGDSLRVIRGGSYADPASALRSAARTKLAGRLADNYTGFRVVQEFQALRKQ